MEGVPDRSIERMAQFLTTEHFTLQGARNGTISEANGRLSSFLSTVASGVIALAFVAEVSGLDPVFFLFSVVIFPILIFLGITTLTRLTQLRITDALLVQGINRIRHGYIELAPEAETYFSFPHHDDPDAVQESIIPFHSPPRTLDAAVGPLILINSFLVGVFASIVVASLLPLTITQAIAVGFVVLVLALWLHVRYARRYQKATWKNMEVRFPTPTDRQ